MNNPYKLIVFDWEGTIADTLGVILQTVVSEAQDLGFGTIDANLARKYVDLGLIQALRKTFPHLNSQQQEQLLQAVQHTMLTRPTEVCLIPGAKEFIYKVQQEKINLAIATNKGHNSLQRALHASELDEIFKVSRSAGQVPPKPCPQMLEEIMQLFGIDAPATLMIGDSAMDMEMARSAGVTAIGVDFYHQQEIALKNAGAIAVFDDYKLLANFLKLPYM